MDSRFPAWYHAAAIEPKDEFLRKRWQAVEEMASSIDTQSALGLVRLFHSIRAREGTSVEPQFVSVIQKHDAGFTPDRHAQELSVLAGATLAAILKRNQNVGDALALAVVSYNCQGLGSKGSVPEIIQVHRDYLSTRAAEAPSDLHNGPPIELLPSVEGPSVPDDLGTPDDIKVVATAVQTLAAHINKLTATISKLDERQYRFREESNVLWWLMGGHSRDLARPFDPSTVFIVAGKELADLSQSAVGPYAAKAFLDRVAKMAKAETAETVQISTAVNRLDVAWRASWASGDLAYNVQDFCPVALAIREAAGAGGSAWQAAYKKYSPVSPTAKINNLDLAFQVYQESLLLRFFGRNASKA